MRVNTPPRNIRLDDTNFGRDEQSEDEGNPEDVDDEILAQEQLHSRPESDTQLRKPGGKLPPRSVSDLSETFNHGRNASDPSMSMLDTIHGGSGLGPWDEIQLVRRQIAKLNHRLMAVELENQQQQQREMLLTVLVSCYFVGKFFMWLNRSH